MNVTLRQLRAFVALVRTGSFTAASRHLHVTQSALSGLIKELEHGLDVQLVERSTRRVQLSEIGEAFYPWAAKMLEDLDSALRAIADIKELQTGVVRIAAPQLMACTLLPDMVTAFTRQHGAIKVRLVDCAVEEVLDSVQRGEVDFGIGPERALTAETTARPLFDLPFVAIFPPDHALARLNRVTWKDALAYPMISLRGEYTRRLSADLQAVHPELMLEPVAGKVISAVECGVPPEQSGRWVRLDPNNTALTLVDQLWLRSSNPNVDPMLGCPPVSRTSSAPQPGEWMMNEPGRTRSV